METNFNFKSSVCTSREQSERLLALGLKKETADCHWCNASIKGKNYQDDWQLGTLPYCNVLQVWDNYAKDSCWELIPAWSLHRLIEMVDDECVIHLDNFTIAGMLFEVYDNLFDNIIDCIEWRIKRGYFNKEYLV